MTNNKVFTLLIYVNNKYEPPVFKSSKPITEQEYKDLFSGYSLFIYDLFKVKWSILERRFFKEPIGDTTYYKCIIDGEKM